MIKKMDIKNIIKTLGFDSLNPMQEAMLSAKADDRMLLAPTGAGKTLAYLLPTIERIEEEAAGVQVIIISPSRELALQIDTVFRSTKCGKSISCVYGGHSLRTEERSLDSLPTVVVGTPGRLLDHLSHDVIDGKSVQHLIFDEFDKLLEMGFSEEMSLIVDELPNVKYHILTSATKALRAPDFINIDAYERVNFLTGETSGSLVIKKIQCESDDRLSVVEDLLREIGAEQSIIFCNFREQAEEVSDYLYDKYIESEFFHGGMEQFDRERALTKFRNKSVNVLVSTDLASRGLDIPSVKHIIHFELPTDYRAFVHRNGRTARVTESGTAYLLLTKDSYAYDSDNYVEKLEWIEDIKGDTLDVKQSKKEISAPEWTTIYIGKGKKDKLSKVDIVGFLCQKGGITKSEIGVIELKDNHSFVAVKSDIAKDIVKSVSGEKIKNMKTKISLSF